MSKRVNYLIVGLFLFLVLTMVKAEELGACDVTELAKLRQTAANIKVTYVPGMTDGDVRQRYIDLKIFNVSSGMYFTVTSSGDNISGGTYTFDYTKKGADGSITLRQDALSYTVDYEIVVYSNKDNCYGDTLRTFKITIPKFNSYSELGACEEVPEFYLCQEYITFDIDGSTFYDLVDQYKERMSSNEDTSVIKAIEAPTETLKNVSKYKYIIVGIIVVIGIVLTVLILKKKRRVQ